MRNSATSRSLRITAGIMALILFLIVLFSAFYIAAEAEHECCGEDCPICACIQYCENSLHGIVDGAAVRTAGIASIIMFLLAAVAVITAVSQDTLVSRKVRLNN